jgi:release factor glutamine methyltransferase
MTGPWPLGLSEPVSDRARPYYQQMLDRRQEGEPLQYVLGRWGFRELDLLVDRRVLIPRPETEQVVSVALNEFKRLRTPDPVLVDLGTGSGAVALSLALEGKRGEVWGTDVSGDALAVARANLAGMGGSAATRVRLVQGSWWSALPESLRGRITLAVSNPPYVSTPEMDTLPAEVADWEPTAALEAGPTGLEAISAILKEAGEWLASPGALVLELAPHQTAEAKELARAAGFAPVRVEPDLAGRDRALVARRS